jgi:hypothetical protein
MLDDGGYVLLERACRECQVPYTVDVDEQRKCDQAGWSCRRGAAPVARKTASAETRCCGSDPDSLRRVATPRRHDETACGESGWVARSRATP